MTTYIAVYITIGFFFGLYAAYDTEDGAVAISCFLFWPVIFVIWLIIGVGNFLVYIARKIKNRRS